jgi:hydrogenase expression/formation protein HypC
MCLAVPMRVTDLKQPDGNLTATPVAIVESGGIRNEARLDIVDRLPVVGDYVIVHAGFAIHTLDPEEAEANIALMNEMACLAGSDRRETGP